MNGAHEYVSHDTGVVHEPGGLVPEGPYLVECLGYKVPRRIGLRPSVLELLFKLVAGPLRCGVPVWTETNQDVPADEGFDHWADCLVSAYYNVEIGADGRIGSARAGKYGSDYAILQGKRVRGDRLSPSNLIGKRAIAEVRTSATDWDGRPKHPLAHRSIIERMIDPEDAWPVAKGADVPF